MPAIVKCPTCAAAVEWTAESRYRPFCSERCKNIDLGAWSAEQYSIADEKPLDSLEDPEQPGH